MTVPIILDCDPGVDDTFAIFTALRWADLRAITTVAGNVALRHTTRNALAVTQLADSAIPVHEGAAGPLNGAVIDDAADVHGETGIGGVEYPEIHRTIEPSSAIDALFEHTESGDVVVVAVGPLTNIAHAIRRDPTWCDRVPRLVLMGGSTDHGNVTAAAEFNIWADPEAAAEVFESGVDITMVGLNLTRQVQMGAPEIADLRAAGTVTSTFAADALGFYADYSRRSYGIAKSSMHDPCAVLEVVRPDLFERQPMHVAVETSGVHTRGMTLCDHRPNAAEPNTDVLVGADGAEAVRLIMDATIHPLGR